LAARGAGLTVEALAIPRVGCTEEEAFLLSQVAEYTG